MKAVVLNAFGGAEHFADAEIPMPEVRTGEVRIRIRAAAFNPVDHQLREGRPGTAPAAPLILGRDLSGVVDAVHGDVHEFAVGDEVYCNVCSISSGGTYAEYVSVPADLVAMKPRSLAHEAAAAVPVAGITASLALHKVNIGDAASIFVAGGAGGVGMFALPLARLLGAHRILASAGSARSRAALKLRGGLSDADIVDYRDADFISRAMARNGGGFDVALDFAGGRMIAACCELLAVEGAFVSIVDPPSAADAEILFEKNASFHAVGAHAYSLAADHAWRKRYRKLLDHLARLLDHGALAPPPVTVVGPLSAETVRRAHALMESNAAQGKLVMTVDA